MHPFSKWYFQGVEKGCIGNKWVKLEVLSQGLTFEVFLKNRSACENLWWIKKVVFCLQPLLWYIVRVSQIGSTFKGNSLNKMATECMKSTKSTFLGQSSGGHRGDKPIFWVVGVFSPSPTPSPLGETLLFEIYEILSWDLLERWKVYAICPLQQNAS